jgi:hypothetical protein
MRPLLRLLRFVAAVGAAGFAAYLVFAPGYIDVDIAVAKHRGGMGFWWERHRTELAYADSGGVLYVHRQVGSTSDVHEETWKSEAEVFAWFEERLDRLGWKFSVAGINNPPAPESALLTAANHRMYYRPDDGWHSTLFLSVWPRRGSSGGFHVALTTANASLGRRFSDALD